MGSFLVGGQSPFGTVGLSGDWLTGEQEVSFSLCLVANCPCPCLVCVGVTEGWTYLGLCLVYQWSDETLPAQGLLLCHLEGTQTQPTLSHPIFSLLPIKPDADCQLS